MSFAAGNFIWRTDGDKTSNTAFSSLYGVDDVFTAANGKIGSITITTSNGNRIYYSQTTTYPSTINYKPAVCFGTDQSGGNSPYFGSSYMLVKITFAESCTGSVNISRASSQNAYITADSEITLTHTNIEIIKDVGGVKSSEGVYNLPEADAATIHTGKGGYYIGLTPPDRITTYSANVPFSCPSGNRSIYISLGRPGYIDGNSGTSVRGVTPVNYLMGIGSSIILGHNVTYHYCTNSGAMATTTEFQNNISFPTGIANQFVINGTTFTKTGWVNSNGTAITEGTPVTADMDVYAVYSANRQFPDTSVNLYGWYPYGGSEQYRKLTLTLSESFSKTNIRADNVSSTGVSFQSVTINSLTRNSNQTWKVNYTANVPSGYSVTLTPNNNIDSNYRFLTFYDADKTYHELTDWNPTLPYTISSTGTKDIKSHWSNKTIWRYRNSGRFSSAENYNQGTGWYRDVDPQKYDNGVWRDTNLYKYIFNLGWVNQDVDLQINR